MNAAAPGLAARGNALLRGHHPELLAAWVALTLGLRNLDLVAPADVLLPLIGIVLFAALLRIVAQRALGDGEAGAVLASLALIPFLTGGELQRLLSERSSVLLGRFTCAALLWLALAAMLALLWRTVLRRREWTERVTTVLVVMVMVLLLSAGYRAVRAVPLLFAKPIAVAPAAREPAVAPVPGSPDVYFIVADGYVRDDVLRQRFAYDNGPFLAALEARGFYVAHRATSNYAMTFMSLAGTLNMEYVHEAIVGGDQDNRADRSVYYRRIHDNRVAREFQRRGYRYAQVLTSWPGTDGSDIADLVYQLPGLALGEYTSALVNGTLLRAFTPRNRDQHEFAFRAAAEIASVESPTFAFVHLLMPHSPFVYDAEGRIVRDPPRLIEFTSERRAWADREGYVGQLRYVNGELLRLIDAIRARSAVEPIIVLVGDHGSSNSMFDPDRPHAKAPLPKERMLVLTAVLAPAGIKAELYPEITGVNLFRAVLRAGFGAKIEPLPDRNLFAYYGNENDLKDVSAELRALPAPPPQ